jgi:flagellar biosynthesis activator protein FlaF
MSTLMYATRSYRAASASRSMREREADIFRRASGALRAARDAGPIDKVKALADNRRVWNMVRALVRDPENRLDAPLKGTLISIAMSVQREMDSKTPNFDFLITVNENIAAGLST